MSNMKMNTNFDWKKKIMSNGTCVGYYCITVLINIIKKKGRLPSKTSYWIAVRMSYYIA